MYRSSLITISRLFAIFSLFLSAVGLAQGHAAENSEHISTGRILEFSLRNLKESLEKTRQRNDRLKFENMALREDIEHLQQALKNLKDQKSGLLGGEKMPSYRKNPYAIAESYDAVGRRKRVDELIGLFKEDVLKLTEEVRLVDRQIEHNSYQEERDLILKKDADRREQVIETEQKLKFIENKTSGLQERLDQLNEENELLHQQKTILKEKYLDQKEVE